MIATVLNREHADVMVRLAPGSPSGVPVRRFGARYVDRGRYRGTHSRTPAAGPVLVETGHGGKPAPPIVPGRSEFALDTMTPPGFMSDWAFE